MISLHETCEQYVARRLSEGWRIVEQKGSLVILRSPEGIIRPVDIRNDVETLRPNAAGDKNEVTGQSGCSACPNHYTCVDEVVADDNTSYIHCTTDYPEDLYNLSASTGSGTINKITVYARVRAGNQWDWWKALIKAGGMTVVLGAAHKVFDDYGDENWHNYSEDQATDPNTGSAWTWAAIDSLQAGGRFSGANGYIDCTQVYVEVDYSAVSAPTVTSQAVSSIGTTTATGNGNQTDNGGEDASAWGVCYNTTGNPTTADSVAAGSGAGGVGPFTAAMSGLTPGQHYYVKAYATNSAGTGYGGEVEFTTHTAKSVSDTGSGEDATPSIEVALSLAETGQGVDTVPALSPTIPAIPDEGLGTDLIALIEAALTLAETGSGVDAVNVNYYITFINVSDVGEGADVITLAITIPAIEDSGVGVDQILGEYTKVIADQAYSSEWLGVVASMILSELAEGADNVAVQVTPIIADTGKGLDSVVINASLNVAEVGSGQEVITITATIPLAETGVGVDGVVAAVSITIADTGQGIDAVLKRVLQLCKLLVLTRSKARMTVQTKNKARITIQLRGGGQE
ncbi:hypothetical protein ES703_42166 [subsurface metagenome]